MLSPFRLFSRLRNLTRRQILFATAGTITIVVLFWLFFSSGATGSADILVSPKRGDFVVTVTTTGELQAKNSIEIKGPQAANSVGIWQMKISKLVPEGTVVKTGDFVADLDKSEIANRMKESELSVQKLEAQYTQQKLDSTLTLSQARDELVNLRYTLEEKRIVLQQSTYEAPAVKRQAQIDFDRAKRSLEQAKKNYVTKTQQAIAKIKAVEADYMKEKQRYALLGTVMQQFTIVAPADGMVVYAREWNGKKRLVGSTLSPWDPAVATLPDLGVMESITYVNEVDIQKIRKEQTVRVKLDADPNKVLEGTVTDVANIGEQRPNSDSKVFEVRILINKADTTLRPSMTTSNEIKVAAATSVLFIPLECVHAEQKTTFVYLRRGGSVMKQEVRLGLQNDNDAVVLEGVGESDDVYLSQPAEAGGLELELLKAAQ